MRTSALTMSTGFHVAVIAAAMISLPWLKKDFDIPPPIIIEFVDVGPITQTTKQAPVSTPKPPKEEPKKEEPPPPAPKNTAQDATPPAPKKNTPEPKKEEPKKETRPKVDPNALPDKKKPPKKEEKPDKAAEPDRDFSSVLKNLADPKKTPAPPAQQPDMGLESKPVEGHNAPLGQKMTMREEDALRRQLERCWNVPYGAKDADNTSVEIFMVINPDRTLRDARVVDSGRYNRDTFFRAMADSALRAVRNPLCSPFELPADKYDVWKTTTVNFNPSQMF